MYTAKLFLLTIVVEGIYTSNDTRRSSKKGVVVPSWPNVKCGDLDAFSSISWWYNYHTFPEIYQEKPGWCRCQDGKPPADHSVCFPSDPAVLFIPLIHGMPGYGNTPDEEDPPVREEFATVLGFNEPNQPDQSDIPPEEAAVAWVEIQEQYPNKILVSPACSGVNTEWMDAFMEACDVLGCRVDYIATHVYPKGLYFILVTICSALTYFRLCRRHDEETEELQ